MGQTSWPGSAVAPGRPAARRRPVDGISRPGRSCLETGPQRDLPIAGRLDSVERRQRRHLGDHGCYRGHTRCAAGETGLVLRKQLTSSCTPSIADGPSLCMFSGRRFDGGELRVFDAALPLHTETAGRWQEHTWRDWEPEHDSIVFFLPTAWHEVRPVSCPSKQHADSRFAINGWLCSPDPANRGNDASP
ncbi:2OG-Fe(II) oxygenase [Streptomyces sp. NPDC054804]